jgi:hypothetical protein
VVRAFLERGFILGDGALDICRLTQVKSQTEIGSDVYVVRVFGESGDVIFFRRFVLLRVEINIVTIFHSAQFSPIFVFYRSTIKGHLKRKIQTPFKMHLRY